MKIIADTCVWSMALRREATINTPIVNTLKNLIMESRIQLIGPIRQELLSGIKSKKQFELLKGYLDAFDDLVIVKEDYELAAEYFNMARRKGIQGSTTDFLICAISVKQKMPIFTLDNDFSHFQSIIPIQLFHPGI